ncbi:MAG: chloride channel protein [Methylicorpusculum sp.]|uniref:chloride channel protein n=1 Tax=Methylicorpusculum sp. TaxID=2713644 RepID=UPI002721DFC7|nr:chloride channel protein [Methylicorpusculum sp.]MDO8846260.1 chloride channel protein [Methylicorpusculum sp.]MDO8938704.1 chloride channel protein [Methylicorpusculum sp.]MDP2177305.1 chloride channel protein [Methylicorpusculum sp.]MDP2203224.1 chloride channel protein [Methylicorpusculum sp.]MDP3529415.1 chloride channel protein [Methylicorpusculum sp.]
MSDENIILDKHVSYLSLIAWKHRLVFWIGAIVVGLVIVVLTWLSEWTTQTYHALSLHYPWFQFIIPPIGMGLTAWLTFRFFPGSERSGIPQIKAALELSNTLADRAQLVSIRISFGKVLLTMMGLLSGASVGLGGPAIHVGASIMLSLGKITKFPSHYMEKGLILAGSAAGFAAMFSTPLAGIIFAIEEMGRNLEERLSSLVLTAIIFSGVTAYALINRYIYFGDESLLIMPWGRSWLAVPLCGIVGGFLGGLFSKVIILGIRLLNQLDISFILVAIICGGVIAVVNYLSGNATVGTGYQQIKLILKGIQPMEPSYPLLKMMATCATFFSGIPSGIFVPSLATGAGIGVNLANWFPLAPLSAMILLTMTAYFSGMLQSPLTSFVIVMEMTNSHEILIPLMAAAFLANGTSKLIHPVPLYVALFNASKYHLNKPVKSNGN